MMADDGVGVVVVVVVVDDAEAFRTGSVSAQGDTEGVTRSECRARERLPSNAYGGEGPSWDRSARRSS